jgi:hypothetical protein
LTWNLYAGVPGLQGTDKLFINFSNWLLSNQKLDAAKTLKLEAPQNLLLGFSFLEAPNI